MVKLATKVSLFSTEFGWSLMSGAGQVVQRLLIGCQNAEAARSIFQELVPEWATEGGVEEDWYPQAREAIQKYSQGEQVDFDFIQCDLSGFTPFQQSVLELVRKIPRGEVLTYGEVAHLVKHPKAARAVGGTMAKNSIPLIIPCHRVIGSNGQLTGFSAPRGLELKQQLLEMEQAISV